MRQGKAIKLLHISIPTLISYRKRGLIEAKQNPLNGYWDYDEESIYKYINNKDKRDVVVYGRVSTSNQSKDLENQINSLIEYANKNQAEAIKAIRNSKRVLGKQDIIDMEQLVRTGSIEEFWGLDSIIRDAYCEIIGEGLVGAKDYER